MAEENQGTAEGLAQDTTAAKVAEVGTEQQVTEGETKARTEGEEAAEQAGDKPEGETTERKKLSGAEKAKRRQTFLLNQLAERDRELEDLRRQASQRATGGDPADKEPKEEDFNGDWGAFIAAKAAFAAGKAVEGKLTARENRETEAKRNEAVRERDIAHLDRIEEAREVITDYDQVMSGMRGRNVANELIEEIKSSDKSALVAYHLAKNPDELDRLNNLTGRELAREMGRLEATLKMPAAKKQTTAPPPPSRVTGGSATEFDPAKAGMDEFASWLNKKLTKAG